MKNLDIIQKYFKLQHLKGFISEIIELPHAIVVIGFEDTSPYSNLAWVNTKINQVELEQIEKVFISKKKKPVIYFENIEDFNNLKVFLTKQGYAKEYEESWMFYPNARINIDRFSEIRIVENEEDLAVFLNVFNESYQKDDPQNPYGTVTQYIVKEKSTWITHHQQGLVENFIGFKGNLPVAVSALTNFEGIGYICDVGSLKNVRGEGFGKLVTLFAVNRSKINNNQYHFLITEEGSYPNEFYKRIGFRTEFITIAFSKK